MIEANCLRNGVLLVADDIGIFLAVARSLGRAGLAVDIATSETDYPGLESKYVRHVHMLPGYLSQPADWAEAVVSLVDRHGYCWVIPTSDSSLILLNRLASRLGQSKLAVVNKSAIDIFSDKAKTRNAAEAAGIPIARGMALKEGTSAREILTHLGLPLVLKPRSPYSPGDPQSKVAAVIVYEAEELETALDSLQDREIIAEQVFDGEGVGLSVLAKDGEILLAWQHRRLAEVGETGRSCRRAGEPINPRLMHDVEILSKTCRLTGVAMFEFRQDNAKDEHILIEVNARFWGSLPLALAAGIDFPSAYWRMIQNDPPVAHHCQPRFGMAKSDLSGEFDRLGLIASSGKRFAICRALSGTIMLVLKALVSPASFDSWAADDPRPFRAEVAQIGKHLRDAIMRRVGVMRCWER